MAKLDNKWLNLMCIQLSYKMEGTDFTLAMIRPRIEGRVMNRSL